MQIIAVRTGNSQWVWQLHEADQILEQSSRSYPTLDEALRDGRRRAGEAARAAPQKPLLRKPRRRPRPAVQRLVLWVNGGAGSTTPAVTTASPPPETPAPERVLSCLVALSGTSLCHSCIGQQISLEFEQVRKAVFSLRADGRVRVSTGYCSLCVERRLIVLPADGHAITGPAPRIIRHLLRNRGRSWCAGCIAAEAGTGLGEVRRLLPLLTHAKDFAAGNGACAACGAVTDVLAARPHVARDDHRSAS